MCVKTDAGEVYAVGTVKGFVQPVGIGADEQVFIFLAEGLLGFPYLGVISFLAVDTVGMVGGHGYADGAFDALTSEGFADGLKLADVFFFRGVLDVVGFSLMPQNVIGDKACAFRPAMVSVSLSYR